MPITSVERVGAPADDGAFGARLVASCGAAFDAWSGTASVRVLVRDPAAWSPIGGPRPGVLPVFVTALAEAVPAPGDRTELARVLAQAVGRCCGVAVARVHVQFVAESDTRRG